MAYVEKMDLPKTARSKPLVVYSDATVRPDGMAICGWAFCNHNHAFICHHIEHLGEMKSSQAEKESVKRIIQDLDQLDHVKHLKVHSDFATGIKNLDITEDYQFEYLSVDWIPREENTMADLVAELGAQKHE